MLTVVQDGAQVGQAAGGDFVIKRSPGITNYA